MTAVIWSIIVPPSGASPVNRPTWLRMVPPISAIGEPRKIVE